MPVEIERKFLLKSDAWKSLSDGGKVYRQGYFTESGPGSVRVRMEGDKARINIKSATLDIRRLEYEYDIPVDEAQEMLSKICIKPLIEKVRHHIEFAGKIWEVDVFAGENQGLIVAEIELDSEDEVIELPDWVGDEVTSDTRYYNVCLVKHPYKDW